MFDLKLSRRLSVCVLVAALSLVAGCGGGGGGAVTADAGGTDGTGGTGGGGSSSSGGASQATGVVVVPALGAFSVGALVEAYNPTTGAVIGSGVATDADGVVDLDLGAYTGSFILKVSGTSGATYFEEGLSAATNFSTNDALFALVPVEPNVSVTKGSRVGVTPLTHMAAGFAINSATDLKVTTTNGQTIEDVMYAALARTRYILGLGVQTNERAKIHLNPVLAPTTLNASNLTQGVDLTTAGGYQGLLLAEISKAVSMEQPARSSLTFAKSLFSAAAAMKAANFVYSDVAFTRFASSGDVAVLASATSAVSQGVTSTYANKCKAVSPQDAIAIEAAFSSANIFKNSTPNASDLAQLVTEIKTAVTSKITKNQATSFDVTLTHASGC